MLLRRVVEGMDLLRTREHLEQVKALLQANPVPEAQQEVSAWLKRRP